jgi:hypothetical protein
MKKFVRNPSIELVRVKPRERLKELLAMADYGLSPVFSHSTGTFVKVLSYISAGLDIIASSLSIVGLDLEILKKIKIYIVRNKEEYAKSIIKIIHENKDSQEVGETFKTRNIILCNNINLHISDLLKRMI